MTIIPWLANLLIIASVIRVAGAIAAAGLVVCGLARLRGGLRRPGSTRGRLAAVAAMMLIGAAVGANVIFPTDDFPHPTGPFAIGQIALGPDALIESQRRSAEVAGLPRPVIKLWYPADAATVARGGAPGWRALRRWIAGGRGDFSQGALPMAAGKARFPVIVYSPGWPGTAIENHALIGNLVSHGFVVAGLYYPFKSPGMSSATFARWVRELEKPMDYSSEAAYRQTVELATARVRFRAADAVALLAGLVQLDGFDARFAQRLDLDRAGIIGFSLGGAVAAEASTLEPRVRAVVNMDGRHWGTALEQGVSQPYLFIGEELLQPSAADLAAADPDRRYNAILDRYDYSQLRANLRRNGGIQVTVTGAEHMNFTDLPMRARIRRLTGGGRIKPKRAAEIVNAYTLAFFEQTLSGAPSALLTPGPGPFAEARIDVWKQ